jgi:hypothetical protein
MLRRHPSTTSAGSDWARGGTNTSTDLDWPPGAGGWVRSLMWLDVDVGLTHRRTRRLQARQLQGEKSSTLVVAPSRRTKVPVPHAADQRGAGDEERVAVPLHHLLLELGRRALLLELRLVQLLLPLDRGLLGLIRACMLCACCCQQGCGTRKAWGGGGLEVVAKAATRRADVSRAPHTCCSFSWRSRFFQGFSSGSSDIVLFECDHEPGGCGGEQ